MAYKKEVLNVGDIDEVGFSFRNKAGNLVSPTALTVTVWRPDGTTETFDQLDARVTIGSAVSDWLYPHLEITHAENQTGTGIVSVEITITMHGKWAYKCAATAGVVAAATTESFAVPDPAPGG